MSTQFSGKKVGKFILLLDDARAQKMTEQEDSITKTAALVQRVKELDFACLTRGTKIQMKRRMGIRDLHLPKEPSPISIAPASRYVTKICCMTTATKAWLLARSMTSVETVTNLR